MEWQPLELWRASQLAAETSRAEHRFKQIQKEGDQSKLQELRQSVQARIDELESFYVANVDDERAVLFERQRFKLRKLLHDAGPVASSGRLVRADPTVTRRFHDDSRLSEEEMLAWVGGPGGKGMKRLEAELVSAVFRELARHHFDGRLSPRDFKSWYLSFGRNGATVDNMFPATRKAAESAKKKGKAKKKGHGPAYPWDGASTISTVASRTDTQPETLVGLPGNVLEFQIKLTPDEFAQLQLRKRRQESEKRHKQRMEKAASFKKDKESKSAGAMAGGWKGKPVNSTSPTQAGTIAASGPYIDPQTLESYIYRSDEPTKWLTSGGFEA